MVNLRVASCGQIYKKAPASRSESWGQKSEQPFPNIMGNFAPVPSLARSPFHYRYLYLGCCTTSA